VRSRRKAGKHGIVVTIRTTQPGRGRRRGPGKGGKIAPRAFSRWLMKRLLFLALLALIAAPVERACATPWQKDAALGSINRKISGRIMDHTANHGSDHRIWSAALGQKRDLYVYLPPNYDKDARYPFLIFMHGFGFDEQTFLHIVPYIDEA